MNRILAEIGVIVQRFEALLGRQQFPPLSVLLVESHVSPANPPPAPFTVKDLIGDGFLWAVPKHRRTIETRMKRKYGDPKYILKTLQVKTNLATCDTCGNDYERDHLCPHCYDRIRKETESIKDKIMKKLKLKPVDSEVVVLYEGEKPPETQEFWNGKRIIEMEKPRPQWFSKNLLQKSTQPNAKTTDAVKPDELG